MHRACNRGLPQERACTKRADAGILAGMKKPLLWLYLGSLVLSIAVTFALATPSPEDDFGLYQTFIERLAAGSFDLTIPGFHGTDFFGLPIFLITRSPISQIYGLMIAGSLLPIMAYAAGRLLYRDEGSGVLLAAIVSMMPFVIFVCLRGWTGPGYWFWMLLSVAVASRSSRWWGIPWALAVLSKPFAFALLPVLIVLSMGEEPHGFFAKIRAWKRKDSIIRTITFALVTGLSLIALYVLTQYLQAGRVFAGAHVDIDAGTIFQGPQRIFLNLAHGVQILFSVHNYYYVDPALTGPGNMLHTTPVLMFLGFFALLSPKAKDGKLLGRALLIGFLLAFAMNALLDHMDHFYMEAAVLMLILAALPLLWRFPLWIPVTYATLLFQWFYFYLQYKPGFALGLWFFLTPALVGIWGIVLGILYRDNCRKILRESL